MADFRAVLAALKQERDKLDAAIAAIESLTSSSAQLSGKPVSSRVRPAARSSKPKGRLSAAGRARIAAAARARWAKFKAQKSGKNSKA